jgi:hypothetical protein
MRIKTLLCAAGIAALAIPAMAQTPPVYSLNVVGYVNRSIPPGTNSSGKAQFAFISNPLDTRSNVLNNLLMALPTGTKVLKWNTTTSGFDTYTRSILTGGWSPSGSAATVTLNPNEGAFVQLPGSATAGTNITFVGNVLQNDLSGNPAATNVFKPGFTIQAYPVPISGGITNFGINAAIPTSPSGSKILQWDEVGQSGYNTFTRSVLGSGWSPSVPQVSVASCFFVYNAGTTNRNWIINFTVQ